jgi:hypothetical protein
MKALNITVSLSNGILQEKKLHLVLLVKEFKLLFKEYLIPYE